MSKVFKRKGSQYYYGRIKVNGKDRWVSLKTTEKKKAQQILEQRRSILKGTASIDSLYNDLVNLINELPKGKRDSKKQELASLLMQGKSAKLALADAWDTWHHSPMKRNPGPTTIIGYKRYWDRFENWAREQGVEYLHEVDAAMAQSYCKELRKGNFAPRTYNGNLQFIRGAFKALKVQAGLLTNVWADIPTLKSETESRRNLTPKEISVVCSTAEGALKYMFAIGIFTGMRLGDVCSLKWRSVDLDAGIIEIIPKKTARTGKKVRLPILPPLAKLLNELKADCPSKTYLFPDEHKIHSKSPAVSKRIQNHFLACGIETSEQPKPGRRKNIITRVGFHSLRHSFVSILVKNGVPQTAIAALVGHGSPVMTGNYTHLDDEQRAEAISGISKIIKFDT